MLLEPRSATELVDAAVQLMRRHFRPLATISAIVAIPSLLLGMLARSVQPATPTELAAAAGPMAALMLLALASVCVASVGFGALVSSAAAAYEHGQAREPMAALRVALRRSPSILVANVLATVAITLVLLATLVGTMIVTGLLVAAVQLAGLGGATAALSQTLGLVLGVALFLGALALALLFGARFALVTPAAVLEERGPIRALRRSGELVRGHLRRTAGVVGIGVVFYLVVYFTALALAAILFRDMELASTASTVIVVVAYPFVGCLMTVLYFDLRIRREGYDVERMTLALDGGGPVSPEPAAAAGGQGTG